MNPWHDVNIDFDDQKHLNAIIEIPMGSKIKYELDQDSGLLKVDRILYSSVHYPCNYGFFPQTYGDDGDPLDVLVIGQLPIAPLSIIRVRPIGVLRMIDQGKQDHKIISIHIDDPEFNYIMHFNDLPSHRAKELKNFFEHYKELEKKEVAVSDIGNEEDAIKVIKAAMDLYQVIFAKHNKFDETDHELRS